MKKNELKIRFDCGDFKSAYVVRAVMTEGWALAINPKQGNQIIMELKRGNVRTFRTISAACNMALEIGFSEALVVMRGSGEE